tara:strand:+ start:162069 stop:163157 length:1089 start_codon:yes stop_codon:yes gene_type:complete
MSSKQIPGKQFATKSEPKAIGDISMALGVKLIGDKSILVDNVGTIQSARQGQIAFLGNDPKYRKYLKETKASCVIMSQDVYEQENPTHVPVIIDSDPRQAIVKVVHLIFPQLKLPATQHHSVMFGENCDVHPKTFIGPNVVIGNNVTIGENAIVHTGSVIGDNCVIGANTLLNPKVTIYGGVRIGEDCVIHSGVVIGADGFGFVKQGERWVKVPQIGGVSIGHRVEIGANTTIDRGAIDDTIIEDDVILDNLIQIGHNVKIGQGSAIAACTGIAGSSEIGKHCLIGGATNINGHLKIADFVNIVGCSNVGRSITKPGGAYASGNTVTDIRTWKKNLVRYHQLDKIVGRVKQLEVALQEKEGD